jgi:hypothetical protein
LFDSLLYTYQIDVSSIIFTIRADSWKIVSYIYPICVYNEGMEPDDTIVSEAMRILSSRRTPEGVEHAVDAMAAARRGKPLPEAHKAALREAQAARRERERSERTAAGLDEPLVKRPVGRPKKVSE